MVTTVNTPPPLSLGITRLAVYENLDHLSNLCWYTVVKVWLVSEQDGEYEHRRPDAYHALLETILNTFKFQ